MEPIDVSRASSFPLSPGPGSPGPVSPGSLSRQPDSFRPDSFRPDSCGQHASHPASPEVGSPEPVDLVALAELCDAIFDGDPSDRDQDPHLVAIVDSFGALSFMEHGPVSHDQLRVGVVPPPDCRALVLRCGGWAAPHDGGIDLSDGGRIVDERARPSRHPQRRRIFSTTVVGNDGEIVTVLRAAGDAEPQVLTGPCLGRVPDALRACWGRRNVSRAA